MMALFHNLQRAPSLPTWAKGNIQAGQWEETEWPLPWENLGCLHYLRPVLTVKPYVPIRGNKPFSELG